MITVYKWVGLSNPNAINGFLMETDEGTGSITIEMNTEAQDAIMAYIDYQKGTETSLVLSPSFSEKHINNDKFYNDSFLGVDNTVLDRAFTLDHSTKIRFPIVTAANEDFMRLAISLSPTTGDGVVEIYLIPSSPYI